MAKNNLNEMLIASIEQNKEQVLFLAKSKATTYEKHRDIISRVSDTIGVFEEIKFLAPEITSRIIDAVSEYSTNSINFADINENLDELMAKKSFITDSTVSIEKSAKMIVEIEMESNTSIDETLRKAIQLNVNIVDLEGAVTTLSDGAQEFISFIEQVTALTKSVANIAEHTGLLSLNAAIEAARAGDSGRGFAVVAEQVKILASLTVNLTIEIDGITEKMGSVSRQVGDSVNGCILQLVDSVEKMKEIMGKIDLYTVKLREISIFSKKSQEEIDLKLVPKLKILESKSDAIFARVNQYQIKGLMDSIYDSSTRISMISLDEDESSSSSSNDGIIGDDFEDITYMD